MQVPGSGAAERRQRVRRGGRAAGAGVGVRDPWRAAAGAAVEAQVQVLQPPSVAVAVRPAGRRRGCRRRAPPRRHGHGDRHR